MSNEIDRRGTFRNWARFALAMGALNVKATLAHRGAFWLQATIMMVNNLIFCVTWFIFFAHFEEINGWRLGELLALYGVVALSFGCSVAFSGGTREIARMVVDGDLDTFLAQPKSVLTQAVCSRSFASGWGDIASGFILLGLSGYATLENTPLILLSTLCGWAIIASTAVIAHSLAFWLGPIGDLARQFTHFLITFAVYPQNIYGGWVKVLLFTVVPAGFIGFLPVELLGEFDAWQLAALVGGTLGYLGIAYAAFSLGLRRYESGNRIGVRV
ncbi:MAG: ABC-2 family transporter protein [Planctomycetota bacterium]